MTKGIAAVVAGRALVLVIAVTAIHVSGCRMPDRTPAPERTSMNFADTRRELDELGVSLQQTQAVLNDLIRAPQEDLRPQFVRFEGSFDVTQARARQLWRSVERFRATGRSMMTEWDAELAKIDRTDLRELGRRRREAFGQRYDAIDTGFRSLKKDVDPYLQGLDDTIDFLRVDLNPQSVEEINAIAEDSNDQAAVIARKVGDLSAKLRDISTAISPVSPSTMTTTTTTRPFGTGSNGTGPNETGPNETGPNVEDPIIIE